MLRLPAVSMLVLLLALALPAVAAETVRPEIGKPLQAAEALLKQQKYAEAAERLRAAAAALKQPTPYEASVIDQLRGVVAAATGDHAGAAHAWESVLAYGHQPAPARLTLIQAVIAQYYAVADYPQVVAWVKRYQSEGGAAPETVGLLPQALYQAGDFAAAAQAARELVLAEERSGRPGPQPVLQLLASSAYRLNDSEGYVQALQRLVAAYPKGEYWSALIRSTVARPGFAPRLKLAADRLARATGTLEGAERVVEAAERALQAGYPAEALALLDQGLSAGVLGSGPQGERHRRLRTLAASRAADDRATLPGREAAAAAAATGAELVTVGVAWIGQGEPARGAALIQHGLAKGGLRQAEDARLDLGLALLAAGQRQAAIEVLETVQGGDGSAELARLWLLQAGVRPAANQKVSAR